MHRHITRPTTRCLTYGLLPRDMAEELVATLKKSKGTTAAAKCVGDGRRSTGAPASGSGWNLAGRNPGGSAPAATWSAGVKRTLLGIYGLTLPLIGAGRLPAPNRTAQRARQPRGGDPPPRKHLRPRSSGKRVRGACCGAGTIGLRVGGRTSALMLENLCWASPLRQVPCAQ